MPAMSLQAERNDLLRYALQHPPPNVSLRISPSGVDIATADLTHCPSPLPTYHQALRSPKQTVKFTVHISSGVDKKNHISAGKKEPVAAAGNGGHQHRRQASHKDPADSELSSDEHSAPLSTHASRLTNMLSGLFRAAPATAAASPADAPPKHEGDGKHRRGRATLRSRILVPTLTGAYASIRGHAPSPSSSSLICAAPVDSNEVSTEGEQPRPPSLPLNGAHAGNILEYWRGIDSGPRKAKIFGCPYHIELLPLFDQSMLAAGLEVDTFLTVYEHILLATGLLLRSEDASLFAEGCCIYRSAFDISMTEHERCLKNLLPAHIRRSPDVMESYLRDMGPNAATMRLLVAHSDDDDFVHRISTLLDMVEHNADTPGDGMYPLALRAVMYAAALIPLYRLSSERQKGATCKAAFRGQDTQQCLQVLEEKFSIPEELVPYCHVHARLLTNHKDMTDAVQVDFLRGIAHAVNQLDTSDLVTTQLTPAAKYRCFVLQETVTMSIAPLPWLESLRPKREVLLCMSAVFMEACAAMHPTFLSALVRLDGGPIMPPKATSGYALYALLSVFISAGVLRSAVASRTDLTAKRKTLRQRLAAAAELDVWARRYFGLLQRSMPLAPSLILPAREMIGEYLLHCEWGWELASDNTSNPLPRSICDDVAVLMEYLLAVAVPPSAQADNDADFVTFQIFISQRYLSHVGATIDRYDKVFFDNIKTADCNTVTWATSLTAEPHPEIARYAADKGLGTVPHPLSHDSAETQRQRLRRFSEEVSHLMRCLALLDGEGDAAASSPPCALPCIFSPPPPTAVTPRQSRFYTLWGRLLQVRSNARHHHRDSSSNGNSASPSQPSLPSVTANGNAQEQLLLLPELVQRCVTLLVLSQWSSTFLAANAVQYSEVRRVTGSADVPADEAKSHVAAAASDALCHLSEHIATAILSEPDTYQQLTQQYMRTDMSVYHRKHDAHGGGSSSGGITTNSSTSGISGKKVATAPAGSREVPLAFPKVTMKRIVAQVEDSLSRVMKCMHHRDVVEQDIKRSLGTYIIAIMYAVLLGTENRVDVVLAPSDAPAILNDLEVVSKAFFHADDIKASRMLHHFRSVVTYVMSQRSSCLASGAEGVPPYASLPEQDSNSPWSKATVRRVLEHRDDKDAHSLLSGDGGKGSSHFSGFRI